MSHSGQRGSMPLFRQFHLCFYTTCQQHDEVSLLPASLYTCASPRNVLISSGSWPDASIRSTLRFVSGMSRIRMYSIALFSSSGVQRTMLMPFWSAFNTKMYHFQSSLVI